MMRAALLLMCACSFGGHRPNYQYFVLTTTAQRTPSSTASDESQPTLAVDRVSLPGYLDREQIAMRTRDHSVIYSRTDRWAEPLEPAFERTLREDLAVHLRPAGIQVPTRTEGPTYYLDVEVLRFERNGDRVELWARWTMRSSTEVLDTGDTHFFVPMRGVDSNAMAVAASDAIAQMAAELAVQVRKTDRTLAARERRP
ncbi:MAG TPA: PqiC family protein [Kofleriaceae bacterium]|nr:PqiC family protein [Kofleriaceae bacterium]